MSKPPVSPSSGAGGIKAQIRVYSTSRAHHSLQPILGSIPQTALFPSKTRTWCCSLGIPGTTMVHIFFYQCIPPLSYATKNPHAGLPMPSDPSSKSAMSCGEERRKNKCIANTVVLPNTKRVDSSELRTETYWNQSKTGDTNCDVSYWFGDGPPNYQSPSFWGVVHPQRSIPRGILLISCVKDDDSWLFSYCLCVGERNVL